MSIESLAEEAEIHWTYLSRLEKGDGNASLNVAGKIANALDVELADLVRLAAEQPPAAEA